MIDKATEEKWIRMGLEDREPVGAVLRVGIKNEKSGQPEKNDTFFICRAQATQREFAKRGGGTFKSPVREPHPDFGPFNRHAGPQRQMFRGVLVGATIDDVFRVEYGTPQGLGGNFPQHPDFKPSCSSPDGLIARRLYQIGGKGPKPPGDVRVLKGTPDDEVWGELDCPGEECSYRKGDPCRCKVNAWLYFMPRWVGDGGPDGYMPECLMRWHTKSGASASNVRGFFEQTDRWAREAGLQHYSLAGLPFTLSLAMVTSRKRGTRFPIVSMAHDGELSEFFMHQARRFQLIGGAEVDPSRLITAGTDEDETERIVDAVEIEPAMPSTTPLDDGAQQGSLL